MNNEEKVKNYKKKKIYKYIIIILSLITITLEAFALFQTISFLWGFIPFFLSYYFKGLYEEVNFKDMLKRKKKSKTVETKDEKEEIKIDKEVKNEEIKETKTSSKQSVNKKTTNYKSNNYKNSNTKNNKNNKNNKNYKTNNKTKSTKKTNSK